MKTLLDTNVDHPCHILVTQDGNVIDIKVTEKEEWTPQDGDIVFESGRIIIINNAKSLSFHALMCPPLGSFIIDGINKGHYNGGIHKGLSFRPATPEEKQLLFDALEKKGRRWNPDTKKLEKIPEMPKVGDMVIAWYKWESNAIIGKLSMVGKDGNYHVGVYTYPNAVKFESMEQYEKIRRGEI